VEGLEPRLCLTATLTPYATVNLPAGNWTQSPFVGSPIFADLFGDGRQEVIVEAAGGKLLVYQSDASGNISLYKEFDTGSNANFKSTPVVLPLGNGHMGIFAGLGLDESNPTAVEDGRVFGWDATTGQLLPGWPVSTGTGVGGQTGVVGALATGYLEGPTKPPDIVVTSFSSFITAYRLDGSVLWRYEASDSIISGAVVGDLGRTGSPEVVFGSDTSASPFFSNGGFVNVLNANGSALYREPIGEVAWGSPVLADLYGNGQLEIVAGAGLNFDLAGVPGARAAGNRLYAYNAQGQMLPGWPYHTTSNDAVAAQSYPAPAVADLLGNGQLEVIAEDRTGVLHVVQANGQDLPGFVGGKAIAPGGAASQGDNFASAIVADATGSGHPEIIATYNSYITVFDARGNVVAQNAPPTFQSRPSAAAVGQLDGTGGLELVTVTNSTSNPNYPNQIQFFHLPPSNLTPPWPNLRDTPSGVAVKYSPSFVNTYIDQTFQALLGRAPSAGDLSYYASLFATNQITPFQFADDVATSQEARQREITQLYQRYLNRNPAPSELSAQVAALNSTSINALATNFLIAPEFQARGGSPAGIITLYYQIILGRTPSQAEVNGWLSVLNSGTPLATVANRFLTSEENIVNEVQPIFNAVGVPTIGPDSLATIEFDVRDGGLTLEQVDANILGSGGNYASTNKLVDWVRTGYRDILGREAAPIEVDGWMRAFDTGIFTTAQFPIQLVNSLEAREAFVNQEFVALLGHPATPSQQAALAGYPDRQALIAELASSPEYIQHNGGTTTSFIIALYRDLAGIDLSGAAQQPTLAGIVQSLNSGMSSPAALAQQVVTSPLYYDQFVVAALFQYIPDETLGVLRTGDSTGNPGGAAINPPPGEVSYFVGVLSQGATTDQVIENFLFSPQYITNSAYYKGYYRGIGVRN
jgi:hypothetical protein